MEESITCAHCGSEKIDSFEYDNTLSIKGQEIEYKGSSFRCSNCGDEFDTAESMNYNLLTVRNKLNRTRQASTGMLKSAGRF